MQDVFLDLWKSAERFDNTKSSEKTFVAMIARRRVIDRIRSQQRRPKTEPISDAQAESFSPEVKVGALLEVHEEATKVRHLMGQLSDDERTVLELAIDGGLSQSRIAQQMGLPLGTVKSHARRGMIRLRELLCAGPCEGGQPRV